MSDYKVVLIGDSTVGKTSFCLAWASNMYPAVHVPTIFDNSIVNCQREGRSVSINIWDTSGDLNGLSRIISLSFTAADVFLLCFNIGDPNSLNNIENRWIPFIHDHVFDARFVLFGLKKELRTDQATIQRLSEIGSHPVSYEEAVAVSRRINAAFYCELSVRLNQGFNFAIQQISHFLFYGQPRTNLISGSTFCSKLVYKFRRKLGSKFFFKKKKKE